MQLGDGGVKLDDFEFKAQTAVAAVRGKGQRARTVGAVDFKFAIRTVVPMPVSVVEDKQPVGIGDIMPAFYPESVAVGGANGIEGVVGVEIVLVFAASIQQGVAVARQQCYCVAFAVGQNKGVGRAGGDERVTIGNDAGG